MMIYTVKDRPVVVRKDKTASSAIVNIVPINGKLFVSRIDEGWLKLHNGFYVFETENVVLDDTMNEQNLDAIQTKSTSGNNELNLKFASQRFAEDEGYDYGEVDTENGNINIEIKKDDSGKIVGATVEEKIETTPTEESSSDKSEGKKVDEANSLKVLNEKYANHPCALEKGPYVYATDGNGNVKLDEKGEKICWTYEEFVEAYPDSTLFDPSKSVCEIESINKDGVARVRDNSNGNIFMVDAVYLNANMTPGSSNQWERVSLTEGIYNARERESFIKSVADALTKTVKDIIDSIKEINQVNINMINRIHAYPYQFLPWVDNRYKPEDNMNVAALGRKFSEKIVARAPIFTIRAGVPKFMQGYKSEDKLSIIKDVVGFGTGAAGSLLSALGAKNNQLRQISEILGSDGKYYSFMPAPHAYFTAINPILRYIAVLLNIGDIELPGFKSFSSEDDMKDKNTDAIYQKLADMNWEYMVEHPFGGAYQGAVYFYINSDAQISESFANNTRQSEIANRVNNISDRAAEIQFVLGGVMGAVGASWLTSGIGSQFEDVLHGIKDAGIEGNNSLLLGNSTGAGIFNSLLKNLSTMVSGSKMIFPEIWADSSFGRSYNVTIKLVSPDCDRLSIFLNIFVPLVHILGFVLPRSTASNAYASPFLVQCWYKSMFHIDLGMITSCDIVKGETGAWTEEGLPTQVTVQLQIKDLYQVLSQASGVNGNHILSNPAQMDYFANLCGVNIGASDIERTVVLWMTMLRNGVQDDLLSMPTNILRSINNAFFRLFP